MNLHPSPVQDLARALKAELDRSGTVPHLTLKPYKHPLGDPSPYVWWLAPPVTGPGVATFGQAKLLLHHHAVPDRLFCGLHVERGYDSPLTAAGHRHNSAWAWDRVLDVLSTERPAALDCAETRAAEPLWVYIAAFPSGGGRGDRVHLTWSDGKLHLQKADTPSGELRGMEASADLPDLVRRLRGRPAAATLMHWTDLCVGLACTTDAARPNEIVRCASVLACFGEHLA